MSVLPSMKNAALGSAAGDGRQDQYVVALAEAVFASAQEADVFVVDIHVEEAAWTAVGFADALAQFGVAAAEFLDQGRQVFALTAELIGAAGEALQGSGNAQSVHGCA